MERRVLQRLDVLSVARVIGVIYAILALVGTILALPFFFISRELTGLGLGGPIFGILMLVVAPVTYGAIGALVAAIFALTYNLVSDWLGGIVVVLGPHSPPHRGSLV